MFTLYKKELNYYLNNPIGYIVIVLFAAFANFLFVKDLFVIGSASLQGFFGFIPWLFLVFIPAVSMRTFSEEKRLNTIEVLLTLPISETQVVLAKFFAILTLAIIGLVLTLGLPISLAFTAHVYLPEIFVGYLGAILLGGAMAGISIFFSSLTKNQVVAFLSSVLVIFFLLILSTDFLASFLPGVVQDFINNYGPLYHLQNFVKGVLDFRSLFYFLSLTAVFLFLTIVNLEKRD